MLLSEKRYQAVALLLRNDSRGTPLVRVPVPVVTQDMFNGKGCSQRKAPNGTIAYPVSDHTLFTVDTCHASSCK